MAINTTDKQAILGRIREAGVIGAGGAGFPTDKKLETPVEFVIANGAECEPLLQKDRETLRQDREAFLRGLEIVQQLTGAARVTVALKENPRLGRDRSLQCRRRGRSGRDRCLGHRTQGTAGRKGGHPASPPGNRP